MNRIPKIVISQVYLAPGHVGPTDESEFQAWIVEEM